MTISMTELSDNWVDRTDTAPAGRASNTSQSSMAKDEAAEFGKSGGGSTASRRSAARTLANHQVLCPSWFRDRVETLAERNGVTPGDLVESAMLLATPARLEAIADPGEPAPDDIAVTVVPLANGQTRTFRRKPCLKVRGVMGLDSPLIRRLLSFALALDDDSWRLVPAEELARPQQQIVRLEQRVQSLIEIVRQQHPNVTEVPPRNLREATALLGFPNEWCVDETNLNKRFREMARVFHPDNGLAGCDRRMHSIIEARRLLQRFIGTSRSTSSQS